MNHLNPIIQNIFQKILTDYTRGQHRFEYDHYHPFTKYHFIKAMHKLKNKTDCLLIRRYKTYYLHSDLAYELIDADTIAKPTDLPRISPQSNQKSYHCEPC